AAPVFVSQMMSESLTYRSLTHEANFVPSGENARCSTDAPGRRRKVPSRATAPGGSGSAAASVLGGSAAVGAALGSSRESVSGVPENAPSPRPQIASPAASAIALTH